MSESAKPAAASGDARKRLEEAKRNLDQLKAEEEARKRRIALRKEREEFLRRQRKKSAMWWIKPLMWSVIIFAGLIVVAWYWPQVHSFINKLGA